MALDTHTEEKLEFQKITGEDVGLWYANDVTAATYPVLSGPGATIWATQLHTNIAIAKARTDSYNADKVYKNNELRILAVSHQYDFIAKQIMIYRNMEKLYGGKKAFAIAMAEINKGTGTSGANTPMYKVWLALQEQVDEDKANDDLRKFALKFEGVKSIGNNFEALHRYCQLMKMNLRLEAINALYNITGEITAISYDTANDKTTIIYTDYKTQNENQLIYATGIILASNGTYSEEDPNPNINKIISFDIDIDAPTFIATAKSTGEYLYEVKDNIIKKEEEMWDALGANISYNTKLSNDNEPDTKRNYDYEVKAHIYEGNRNTREETRLGYEGNRDTRDETRLGLDINKTEADIESYKFRNMSSLNNLFLGMAKYAEQQENLAKTTDAKNMWKRIKADANIMYKKIQQADEQPKQ